MKSIRVNSVYCGNNNYNLYLSALVVLVVLFFNIQVNCQSSNNSYVIAPENLLELEEYINKNAPSESAFICVQFIAGQFIGAKQWEKAVEVFTKNGPLFPNMNNRFEIIGALLNAEDEGLKITNLGSGINSDSSEYLTVPTADGQKMYFTRNGGSDGFGGEDIYVSDFENGEWQRAKNLGSTINTNSNEAILTISADGNEIYLFGNYKESLGCGDIFYVNKTKEGWGEIQHLPAPINSENWEADAFITSDGKALFFTSDSPGGIGEYHGKDTRFENHFGGNIDIYVCTKTDTGWSEPHNLGKTINTPYSERTPFLHPDGKTLYFSSDGHYGLGRLDVFKSTRLNDSSWTDWSEPVNLGKEINTVNSDWGYKMSTTGDVAYFSAAKNGGYGHNDIYSITLPKAVRPEEVVTISGVVTDQDGNPIEAAIKWENLSTRKNVGELKSNPQNGAYFITMPLGKSYGYYAEKKGYYSVSENIDLTGPNTSKNIIKNIVLVSIEKMRDKNISVRINNIFFDFNKSDLKPESYPELDRLAKILQASSSIKIEISGHTDNVGSDSYNNNLSKSRAESVVAYLVLKGCSKNCLTTKGFGKSKPVATNETDDGRAQNRRVEFRFL